MNFKTITLLLLMLVIFTGCSGKNPSYSDQKPINRGIGEVLEGKNDDLSKQEKIINALYIVAKAQKDRNQMDYFILKKVSPAITNAEDLIDYCFPDSKNMNNLSQKCEFKVFSSNGYKKDERNLAMGLWNIDKTLNDPFVLSYMNQIKNKRSSK